MSYAWSKYLETGNAAIDQQHKELINAVNSLLDACAKGQGREKIVSTLKFLQDYTVKHFGDEEALQLKYKYPGYSTHKVYHEEFKKTIQQIVQEYQSTGATITLVAKVNNKVASWLINHIKREDAKVAAHIKSVK